MGISVDIGRGAVDVRKGTTADLKGIGPQGPKGDPGKSLEVLGHYATVEALREDHPTGKAGECYAVGDGELWVWSKGAWALAGHTGQPGPKGDPGERGPKGDRGDAGERGPAGERGADGPVGKDGAPGPVGPKGEPGERGQRGEDGAPGPQGERGPQGDPGKDGKDGAANYEVHRVLASPFMLRVDDTHSYFVDETTDGCRFILPTTSAVLPLGTVAVFQGKFGGEVTSEGHLYSATGNRFRASDSVVTAVKIAADAWALSGDLTDEVPGLPGMPKNLQGTVDKNKVTVSWEKPDDDGGSPLVKYRVIWGPLNRAEHGAGAERYVPASETSAVLEDLFWGIQYAIEVSAWNKIGESVPSGPIYVTTPKEPKAPLAPVATAPGQGSTTFTVSWKMPAESEPADKYLLKATWGNGQTYTAEASAGATSLDLMAGLKAAGATGWRVAVTVVARNADGDSPPSNVVSQACGAFPAPTGVAIQSPTTDGFSVTWTDRPEDGTYGYKVRVRLANTTTTIKTVTATAKPMRVDGLQPGVQYEASVAGYTDHGDGSLSVWVKGWTAPNAVPGKVTDLSAWGVGGKKEVTAMWNGTVAPGPGTGWDWQATDQVTGKVISGPAQTNSVNLTGFDTPNLWDVQVRARNAVGAGPWCDPVMVDLGGNDPTPWPPYAPRLSGAQAKADGSCMVQVDWSAGGGFLSPMEATSWVVRVVSYADSKVFSEYPVADAEARQFTTPKLEIGRWIVSIRGKNAVGLGPWSNELWVDVKPSVSRPFEPSVPIAWTEDANYFYAVFDPGNDPGKGWTQNWTCTFTSDGKKIAYDVLCIGAGGGGKGITATLGKGGNGGGGSVVYEQIPAPSADGFTVSIGIGGSTAIDPTPAALTIGGKAITAAAGHSASSAADASGYPRQTIHSDWLDCGDWFSGKDHVPWAGGVAESSDPKFPDGYGWGTAGAGNKGNGGRGKEGLVVVRWAK